MQPPTFNLIQSPKLLRSTAQWRCCLRGRGERSLSNVNLSKGTSPVVLSCGAVYCSILHKIIWEVG